jgi:hypothetical protein
MGLNEGLRRRRHGRVKGTIILGVVIHIMMGWVKGG